MLTVDAPGVTVRGLEVRGSGNDLGKSESCIYTTPKANSTVLERNTLRDCAFGIWIHRSAYVRVVHNEIEGRRHVREADRGNGIHLFDAQESVVKRNFIRAVRDGIYVASTHDSVISYNDMTELRYGVHYMFAYRNILLGNVCRRSGVGFALMDGENLIVEENLAEDNREHGILLRDTRSSTIRRNRVLRNGQGFFIFSSTENRIENNEISDNTVGVKIWAGAVRNEVRLNVFRANQQQIMYVGTSDLVWGKPIPGNFWSNYRGWDQNGDGLGDRPHRVDSFTASLTYRYPAASLLVRSPIVELLSRLEEIIPILRVPTIVDQAPLMQALPPNSPLLRTPSLRRGH